MLKALDSEFQGLSLDAWAGGGGIIIQGRRAIPYNRLGKLHQEIPLGLLYIHCDCSNTRSPT